MEELKPCPFCGGEVHIALIKDEDARWFVTRGVSDEPCGCRVFMESRRFNERDSNEESERIKKELGDAWNRRAERTCRMIDREELLAMADEFEDWAEECRKHYAETGQQGLIGEVSAYRDCARRIREAVGA